MSRERVSCEIASELLAYGGILSTTEARALGFFARPRSAPLTRSCSQAAAVHISTALLSILGVLPRASDADLDGCETAYALLKECADGPVVAELVCQLCCLIAGAPRLAIAEKLWKVLLVCVRCYALDSSLAACVVRFAQARNEADTLESRAGAGAGAGASAGACAAASAQVVHALSSPERVALRRAMVLHVVRGDAEDFTVHLPDESAVVVSISPLTTFLDLLRIVKAQLWKRYGARSAHNDAIWNGFAFAEVEAGVDGAADKAARRRAVVAVAPKRVMEWHADAAWWPFLARARPVGAQGGPPAVPTLKKLVLMQLAGPLCPSIVERGFDEIGLLYAQERNLLLQLRSLLLDPEPLGFAAALVCTCDRGLAWAKQTSAGSFVRAVEAVFPYPLGTTGFARDKDLAWALDAGGDGGNEHDDDDNDDDDEAGADEVRLEWKHRFRSVVLGVRGAIVATPEHAVWDMRLRAAFLAYTRAWPLRSSTLFPLEQDRERKYPGPSWSATLSACARCKRAWRKRLCIRSRRRAIWCRPGGPQRRDVRARQRGRAPACFPVGGVCRPSLRCQVREQLGSRHSGDASKHSSARRAPRLCQARICRVSRHTFRFCPHRLPRPGWSRRTWTLRPASGRPGQCCHAASARACGWRVAAWQTCWARLRCLCWVCNMLFPAFAQLPGISNARARPNRAPS